MLAADDPKLRIKAAGFAWKLNRLDEASDQLREILKEQDAPAEAHRLCGLIAARKGEWEKALEQLDLVELAKTDSEGLQAWLEAELVMGKPQKLQGKQGTAAMGKVSKRPVAAEQTWLRKRREKVGMNPGGEAVVASEYLYQMGRPVRAGREAISRGILGDRAGDRLRAGTCVACSVGSESRPTSEGPGGLGEGNHS